MVTLQQTIGGSFLGKQAVGYIRVSTEGQAVDGVSLEAQRAKIDASCLANDVELSDCYVDAGISGSRADIRCARSHVSCSATTLRPRWGIARFLPPSGTFVPDDPPVC